MIGPTKLTTIVIAVLCAGTLTSVALSNEALAQDKRFYSAGSFTTGTQPYIYMATLSGLLRKQTQEISITNEATGGSSENLDLLRRGEIQLGVASPERLFSARRGIGKYEGKQTDVYIMWQFNQQQALVITLADSGIKSIKDLKGKRVSVGPAGSSNEIKNSAILEAYGFTRKAGTPSEFEELTTLRMTFPESAQALAEGSVDAAMAVEQVPSSYFSELALSRGVRVIGIEPSMFDTVRKVYPALWATSIPADTYKGQTEDVPTLGDQNYVIATRNLPDDDAYLLTKIYIENLLPQMADVINFLKPYLKDAKRITSAFVVPTHPGTLRYYKEKGMKVEEVTFQ